MVKTINEMVDDRIARECIKRLINIPCDCEVDEIKTALNLYAKEIFKELEDALSGMLDPEEVEEILGKAEVRQVFNITGIGTVAGCYVIDGFIKKSANIRVLRDSIEIYDGDINSLKRVKDDASEVKENFECGIKIENFDDIKTADILEAYEITKVERTLGSIKE